MNSRKDFFLFIGATLLLIAGVTAWGLLGQGWSPELVKPLLPAEEARQVAIEELTLAPKGGDYPNTPRASLADGANDWLAPEENDDGWDYDLFTTIDIAWDPAQSEYVPLGRKVIPLPPFGIALVKVGHPTYPYVLSTTMAPRSRAHCATSSLSHTTKVSTPSAASRTPPAVKAASDARFSAESTGSRRPFASLNPLIGNTTAPRCSEEGFVATGVAYGRNGLP